VDEGYPSKVLKLSCSPTLIHFIQMIESRIVFFDVTCVLRMYDLRNLSILSVNGYMIILLYINLHSFVFAFFLNLFYVFCSKFLILHLLDTLVMFVILDGWGKHNSMI